MVVKHLGTNRVKVTHRLLNYRDDIKKPFDFFCGSLDKKLNEKVIQAGANYRLPTA